ncbi:MAG: DNA polymerase I [Microgenomates group bacterium LiPW_16]|nr:MAG: DNA polymerase I [Microgenomates group bacterium LiPW_16]
MKRLILIDGHAILHRAYHALPPLTTSKGELVNAVFGFCSMLLKIRDELSPSYFTVAFDLPKPTFRHKIFASYQAQRPAMAEELSGQIEKIKEVLKTLGIPVYEAEGFEADDVIGTLAKQAIDHKPYTISEVIIVTGDRDMLQLVDEQTKVYMLLKGISEATLYDKEKVEEKFGLEPRQISDYKALIGDPSDNYFGVSGIGPKTAQELLSCFKTLEQIYNNLDKMDKKIKDKLNKGKEQAVLGKKLATIVTDVPVELDSEKARVENFNTPRVRKLFEKLEFKSLVPRLAGQASKKNAKQKAPENNNEQLKLV